MRERHIHRPPAAVDGLPEQETDPGVFDGVLVEISALEPQCRLATKELLGDGGRLGAGGEVVHLLTKGDGHVHCCGRTVAQVGSLRERATLNPHGFTCGSIEQEVAGRFYNVNS